MGQERSPLHFFDRDVLIGSVGWGNALAGYKNDLGFVVKHLKWRAREAMA